MDDTPVREMNVSQTARYPRVNIPREVERRKHRDNESPLGSASIPFLSSNRVSRKLVPVRQPGLSGAFCDRRDEGRIGSGIVRISYGVAVADGGLPMVWFAPAEPGLKPGLPEFAGGPGGGNMGSCPRMPQSASGLYTNSHSL